MNSLINYQEAGSNLITIPATRRAFLCPCWDTGRAHLRPKGSVRPTASRWPDGGPEIPFQGYRQAPRREPWVGIRVSKHLLRWEFVYRVGGILSRPRGVEHFALGRLIA